MACPDEARLIAHLGGELSPDESATLLAHIESCSACRRAAERLLSLRHALELVAKSENPCPRGSSLIRYAAGSLDTEARGIVERHLATCLKCRAEVEDLKASRFAEEQPAYVPEEDSVRSAVRDLIEAFVPAIAGRFDRLWQQAIALMDQSVGNNEWDALAVQGSFEGTLGAGASDPDTVLAVTAMVVGLSVARDVARGTVAQTREAVRKAVRQRASDLRAPKGLLRQLCEVLPDALVKS